MEKELYSLYKYVTDYDVSKDVIKDILYIISYQPIQKNFRVYVGRHTESLASDAGKIFSSTLDRNVAQKEFSGKECCVYQLDLMGIRILDVNKYMNNNKKKFSDFEWLNFERYMSEKEVIVSAGGILHIDDGCRIPGLIYEDNTKPTLIKAYYCPYTEDFLTEIYNDYIEEVEELDDTKNFDDFFEIVKPYLKSYGIQNSTDARDYILNFFLSMN